MLLDTLIRVNGGVNECIGNPFVIRGDFIPDDDPESPLTMQLGVQTSVKLEQFKELKMFMLT